VLLLASVAPPWPRTCAAAGGNTDACASRIQKRSAAQYGGRKDSPS